MQKKERKKSLKNIMRKNIMKTELRKSNKKKTKLKNTVIKNKYTFTSEREFSMYIEI